MDLKAATIVAIIGASLSVVLGVVNLIARFITPLREIFLAGHGSVVNILYTLVSVSYLVFFITLSSKQK